jgi:hypothetical protein
MPASFNSPASIIPVGPPPATTTSCSVIAQPRPERRRRRSCCGRAPACRTCVATPQDLFSFRPADAERKSRRPGRCSPTTAQASVSTSPGPSPCST